MRPSKAKLELLLLISVPLLTVVVLVAVRNRFPTQYSGRSGDPTDLVAEYSNVVQRLKGLEYLPIAGLSSSLVREKIGIDGLDLSQPQKESITTNLFLFITAHHKGSSDSLRQLMSPILDAGQNEWSEYGRIRLSTILKAHNLKPSEITSALKAVNWSVIDRAWSAMVLEYKLTNWWEAISFEGSRCWSHPASMTNMPSFKSPFYGESAGTVVGPSFIGHNDPADQQSNDGAVVAIRLVVKYFAQEKPISFVFRWKWSPRQQFWYPLDHCVGVVGKRRPDPFF